MTVGRGSYWRFASFVIQPKKKKNVLDVTLIILFPKVGRLPTVGLIALIRVNSVLSDYRCPNDSLLLESAPKIWQKPNPTLRITERALQVQLRQRTEHLCLSWK